MNIFVVIEVLFLGLVLYFCAVRKTIKLIRCREKVKGVITEYKVNVLGEERGMKNVSFKPICTYTYDGFKYNELVDYRIDTEKYGIGDELEFRVSVKNPNLAVKTDISEILYMIMIVIVVCFMAVSLIASIGYTKISLVDAGLRLLGAVFVLLYLNNMVTHVILPIMDKVFSKGVLYIVMWIYMTFAMLTVGTIFLILGLAFIMGPETTEKLMKFIQENVNLKFLM